MRTPAPKNNRPAGLLELVDDQFQLSFRYSKARYRAVKLLPKASYDKAHKRWQLPIECLAQLEGSDEFGPGRIHYGFDRKQAELKARKRLREIKAAWSRIYENPFAACLKDIQLADPQVIFYLNREKNALRAKLGNERQALRELEDFCGVHWIKTENSYFFPVEQLNSFLKKLRKHKFNFAIEENTGLRLRQTAELRTNISQKQHGLDAQQLSEAILVPYLDLLPSNNSAEEISFKLYCATKEQEKLCLGSKSLSKAVNEETLLQLLARAENHQIKLWLTRNVEQFLNRREESYLEQIEKHPQDFPEELLNVVAPTICWYCLPDGRPALLVKKQRLNKLRQLTKDTWQKFTQLTHPRFDSHLVFLISDTELVTAFETLAAQFSAANYQQIPFSNRFATVLAEIRLRQELQLTRSHFQNLSDCELALNDPKLEAQLFPHQRVAVAWLREMPLAYLGDDMGLGKTLSVLVNFEDQRQINNVDFLLVICPQTLCQNWIREGKHWLPKLKLALFPQGKAERLKFLRTLKNNPSQFFDGLVINYEGIRLGYVLPEIIDLAESRKVLLCLDESQRAKNPQSKTFEALQSLAPYCERRILLSGTPTPKDITDIWAQMAVLDGGERLGDNFYEWLSSVAELGNRWSEYAVKRFYPEAVKETISRVQELLLRRRKEDVINLPEKIFSIRDIQLRGDQKKRYEEIRKELLLRVSSSTGKTFIREIDNILEEYLRAVQIASNPRLIDENWKGQPAKFLELDEIVQEIVVERNSKLIVWTNYRNNVAELCERYSKLNARGLSGEVSPHERSELIESFQSPKDTSLRILIAIPAAGGVGITLTAAQTAVYLDKTWNAEHWLQSIDRLHRIGQTGTVHIISLHASKVDELISRNLDRKARTQAKLLGDGELSPVADLPSREELLQALSNKS